MIKTETKEIGGTTYTVTTYPATASITMLATLIDAFGEPAIKVAAGAVNDEAGSDPILEALGSLAGRIGIVDTVGIAKSLMGSVRIGDAAGPEMMGQFEMHFAGRLSHLLDVCRFVIGANYGDFIAGFRSLIPAPQKSAAVASDSP